MKSLLCTAFLFASASVYATPAIDALVACEGDFVMARITASYDAAIIATGQPRNDAAPLFDKADACLAGALKPAVEAASTQPALAEAVKAYYVGAKAYLSTLRDVSGGRGGYERRSQAANAELTPLRERLKMERDLASG